MNKLTLAISVVLAAFSQVNAQALDESEKTKKADEAKIRMISDVSYLGEGRAEKMDIYLPAVPTGSGKLAKGKSRPAVLIVHGGGWHGGDKAAAREKNIGMTLAGAGYVCASVNYVLADKKKLFTDNLKQVWPQNLLDCRTAVRFLREKADQYGIDVEHIGAIGGSAGGHLVAMLAFSEGDFLDGKDGGGSTTELLYARQSDRIQAVVAMYGVHDFMYRVRIREMGGQLSEEDKAMCLRASPVSHISIDDPPALLLHGTKDKLVPTE